MLRSTKSSGYGFPFTLRRLNFFNACDDSFRRLSDLLKVVKEEESSETIRAIMEILVRVTENARIRELAGNLHDVDAVIFQRIRKAFRVPERGNLSNDAYDPERDDAIVHERCSILFGELEVYLHAGIRNHMFKAARMAIHRYMKREKMLFAQNSEGTIPRTNNRMEIFFRRIRRNVRKRCGNISTGNVLAKSGETLALFENIDNERYRNIVFGNDDIGSVFGKYRIPSKKDEYTKKRIRELVRKGTVMLLNDSVNSDPYSEEMFYKCSEIYKNNRNNG